MIDRASSPVQTERPKNRWTPGVRTSPDAVTQSSTIELVPLKELKPAAVNDTVYKPVSENDPSIIALSKDIKAKGLLQPLDVTRDGIVVSGHRRLAACRVAGLKRVPARRIDILSTDPRFESYLVSFNQ